MAHSDPNKVLDQIFENVDGDRRGFLKRLLGGSAALAVIPLMTSEAAAQEEGEVLFTKERLSEIGRYLESGDQPERDDQEPDGLGRGAKRSRDLAPIGRSGFAHVPVISILARWCETVAMVLRHG